MKGYIFRFYKETLLVFLLFLALITNSFAEEKKQRHWLVPDYVNAQFAGYIGMFSAGTGYSVFKDHIHFGLMYGYVPYSEAKTTVHTLAFKSTGLIYKFRFGNQGMFVSPSLSAGVNFDSGENSTLDLSSKYPKGYYMTNSFHFPISAGFVLSDPINLKGFSRIEYGVEVGTLATYLYYRIDSPEIDPGQIYSLSFNLKMHFN